MKITIETDVPQDEIKAYLEATQPKVPVFFDQKNRIVIQFNPDPSPAAISGALDLLRWLLT